jgi:hypothetical protein
VQTFLPPVLDMRSGSKPKPKSQAILQPANETNARFNRTMLTFIQKCRATSETAEDLRDFIMNAKKPSNLRFVSLLGRRSTLTVMHIRTLTTSMIRRNATKTIDMETETQANDRTTVNREIAVSTATKISTSNKIMETLTIIKVEATKNQPHMMIPSECHLTLYDTGDCIANPLPLLDLPIVGQSDKQAKAMMHGDEGIGVND